MSRRALAAGVVSVLAVVCSWTGPLQHVAAGESDPSDPVEAAAPVLSISAAATLPATGPRPARRLSQSGAIRFPMEPLPKCLVTDSFADERSGGRSHEGIDIMASVGQPLYAVADGTLVKQYVDDPLNPTRSGNGWRLNTADRTAFFYFHLSGFAPGLSAGSRVKAGDLIGFVGDTGNPGPGNYHLHFEYHPLGGEAVDPLPLLEIPKGCRVG